LTQWCQEGIDRYGNWKVTLRNYGLGDNQQPLSDERIRLMVPSAVPLAVGWNNAMIAAK